MNQNHWGYGVGLRTEHFLHLRKHPPQGVDLFEIISENYFFEGGMNWEIVEKVRQDLPMVLHGVSMGIGNVSAVDPEYLAKIKELCKRIEPKFLSDHLCWGGYGGHSAHDLLPLPYTLETANHIIEKVSRVQDYLGTQILLENVSSYVSFAESEMKEWEFIDYIAKKADCGLLLDVNNIFVSANNHSFDPLDFLQGIPKERVQQYHIAGHSQKEGYILDSHIGPVPQTVWDLYRHTLHIVGDKTTIIEWDEEIPAFENLADEAILARNIAKEELYEK